MILAIIVVLLWLLALAVCVGLGVASIALFMRGFRKALGS